MSIDCESPLSEGFVDVLASGVHDTKNTLFDALGRIESVRRAMAAMPEADPANIASLAEAAAAIERSADRLAQTLSAYRLVRHENPVVLLPTPLGDFAEYVRLRAVEAWQGTATLTVNPPPDDIWFMDRELIADCVVNALTNASRHARTEVALDLRIDADGLTITVTDDGSGYSDDVIQGRTPCNSIGLYIAGKLARLHAKNGRTGQMILANRSDKPTGAVFTLMLP